MEGYAIQEREHIPYSDEPQQATDFGNWRRERFGNNKAKVKKSVAKAKRKMAKVAKRKNR